MANIQISKLNPSGSELFSDSESYLNELSEQELTNTTGGWAFIPVVFATARFTFGVARLGLAVAKPVKHVVDMQRRG